MSGRRPAQLAAVVVQTAVLVGVVGRVDALTLPGEVLAVLLPLVGSLVAARGRPVVVVPVVLAGLVAVSAAGLPVALHVVLGTAGLVQLVLADPPGAVATSRLVGPSVLAGVLALALGAVGLALLPSATWVAVAGPAAVAAALLALVRRA